MTHANLDPIVMILLIVNLLLVGLAWWNFKETRRMIQTATQAIQDFLKGESAQKIATALEKENTAARVQEAFLRHTHGEDGKVI